MRSFVFDIVLDLKIKLEEGDKDITGKKEKRGEEEEEVIEGFFGKEKGWKVLEERTGWKIEKLLFILNLFGRFEEEISLYEDREEGRKLCKEGNGTPRGGVQSLADSDSPLSKRALASTSEMLWYAMIF